METIPSDGNAVPVARPVVRRVDRERGYAAHFECRPEPLFRRIASIDVVDASILVRERAVGDLKVFSLLDVFSGRNEILFGFGTPNAFLVVPDGNNGYEKFAGKSLKRAPSVIEPTGGRCLVQSGIILRFTNLPEEAAESLRAAMKVHHGNKYWTCVNACLRVMEDAGFTSADGRKLSDIYFPYAMMRHVLEIGLKYNGVPVELEVIRTSPLRLETYTLGIIRAELATFRRHADRNLTARASKSKFFAGVHKVVHFPERVWNHFFPQKAVKKGPVAPALPDHQDYCADIKVRVSTASITGMLLRFLWGPHTLFEAQVEGIRATDFFEQPLRPFPQANPSLATRIKKWFLFNRLVIWGIRRVLAPRFDEVGMRSEADVYDMMRTHSEENPNKYNIVITGLYRNGECVGVRITISRTTAGLKLADWIFSKHVLVSGYDEHTFYASETWKSPDGAVNLNRDSGTYLPGEEAQKRAVALVKAVFPHWNVVMVTRAAE